jgi:hypothetical protein
LLTIPPVLHIVKQHTIELHLDDYTHQRLQLLNDNRLVQLKFRGNVHFLLSPQYLALMAAFAIASLELEPTVFPVDNLTTFHGLFDPLT